MKQGQIDWKQFEPPETQIDWVKDGLWWAGEPNVLDGHFASYAGVQHRLHFRYYRHLYAFEHPFWVSPLYRKTHRVAKWRRINKRQAFRIANDWLQRWWDEQFDSDGNVIAVSDAWQWNGLFEGYFIQSSPIAVQPPRPGLHEQGWVVLDGPGRPISDPFVSFTGAALFAESVSSEY